MGSHVIIGLLITLLLPHQFWRGTLGEAKEVFSIREPKGEITLITEGKAKSAVENPPEYQLENELQDLISSGHSLSTVRTSSHLPDLRVFSRLLCT